MTTPTSERLKAARIPWEVLRRFNDAWAQRPEDPLIAYATDAMAGRSGPGTLAEACTRIEELEERLHKVSLLVNELDRKLQALDASVVKAVQVDHD